MKIESRISPDSLTRPKEWGHTINFSQRSTGMGSLRTVMWEDGVFYCYSDPGRPSAGKVGVV
jgi:hypothetical protein